MNPPTDLPPHDAQAGPSALLKPIADALRAQVGRVLVGQEAAGELATALAAAPVEA